MKISTLDVDRPHQKEFSTTFAKPLLRDETRWYTLEYDVEEPERYFENSFLTDCERFVLSMDMPPIRKIKRPSAYELDTETDKKERCKIQPSLSRKGIRHVAIWTKRYIFQGQCFRFEW